MNETLKNTSQTAQVLTPSELIAHWQGHRNLTRRVIEAFPEDELFKLTIGGMRPFSDMVKELLAIAGPGIHEIVTGEITPLKEHTSEEYTKKQLLQLWDETTKEINAYGAQLKIERFHEMIKLFGQYENTVISSIFYFIDNEIHHRGQAYVYLRSLGITPPFFWER